ncbi:protein indeterminate-domain 5, chloroplastic-like [Wolffia australiana]
MAAPSSSSSFFSMRGKEFHHQMKQQQQEHQTSSNVPSSASAPPPLVPQKKRRNLPGTPNPDAEVIALSPKTLMATNRFICEVCNKGFQREQNLQLHRRGHNLPWKLRQKSSKEVRKRVYLCPEPTCVHHDPSRALGDLTGIKKHYLRKHGEKKWKCEKCSKRYAVQSDWKAHSKTCGTREYRCDCGTLFSRRDSFITHRAFCDALAQESSRLPSGLTSVNSHLYGGSNINLGMSQVNPQISSFHDNTHLGNADLLRLGGGASQFDPFRPPQPASSSTFFHGGSSSQDLIQNKPFHGLMQLPDLHGGAAEPPPNLFNLSFFANSSANNAANTAANAGGHLLFSDQFNGGGASDAPLFSSGLMGTQLDSLYTSPAQLSATALLQKAAQMGSSSSKQPSFKAHMQNEAHIQNLMNSLAGGGVSFGAGHEEDDGFAGFGGSLCSLGESKLHENLSMGSMGGSDGLTRDFLGVGSVVRSIGGGMSQRDQRHGLDLGGGSSFDSELKPASASRAYPGGSLR